MQKFYFSFIFHSKLGVSYFLPLKVISKDKISACHCYEAMKVALSQSFTVDSSEEPIEETLGFISEAIESKLKQVQRGRFQWLRAFEWRFEDFQPSLDLCFDSNLINAVKETNVSYLGGERTLARCINHYIFPIQVLNDPEEWKTSRLLTIQLVSVD